MHSALYYYPGLVLLDSSVSTSIFNLTRATGSYDYTFTASHLANESLHGPRSFWRDAPSEKLLMASFRGPPSARYPSVTSGSPSRIIKCTIMRDLNTMVHVESRKRFWRARKTSPTAASPACVATRMCSTYLDFGAASYKYRHQQSSPLTWYFSASSP